MSQIQRLIESRLSVMVAALTAVGERIGIVDARIAEQARRVASLGAQDREIADAVANSGKPSLWENSVSAACLRRQ
jgi:hypothetical protein